VGHFTTWNADKPVDLTDCVTGVVVDDTATPVPAVQVRGVGQGTGASDASGAFCLNFFPGTTFDVVASGLSLDRRWSTPTPATVVPGDRPGGVSCAAPAGCLALAAPLVLEGSPIATRCLTITVDGDVDDVLALGEITITDITVPERAETVAALRLDGVASHCLALLPGSRVDVVAAAFSPGGGGETFCRTSAINGQSVEAGIAVDLGVEGSRCGDEGCDTVTLTCEAF
jgi:hypothetical protein